MEEINILLMIGVSLMGGVLIGIICTILLINDNTKELEKEVDKLYEQKKKAKQQESKILEQRKTRRTKNQKENINVYNTK